MACCHFVMRYECDDTKAENTLRSAQVVMVASVVTKVQTKATCQEAS